MEIKDLSHGNKFKDISFTLRSGEILGVAGLVGAGRSEMAECIFGITQPTSGEIFIKDQPMHSKHPQDAIRQKIALITEDRKFTGLNLKGTVKENITIVGIQELARLGLINESKESTVADSFINDLRIKTNSCNTMISNLSGGNQQKVVLAKWLFT
jgi:ABC-type sugar transport system ATPase subunit